MSLWDPRPRQPFAGLAGSAIAGILTADYWAVSPLWLWPAAVTAAFALWKRPRVWGCWLFCGLIFFALHTLLFRGHPARVLAADLTPGPQVIQATGIVWSEPELPAFFSKSITCHFRLRLEALSWAGHTRADDFPINVSWAGPIPSYGDRVTLTGSAHNLTPPRNPGQYDFRQYQQRQGIFSEIVAGYAQDCRVESHGHGSPLQVFALASRRWIQRQLEVDLADSPEITSLIESMVLGLRGETPPEVKELFQRTGTLHLFAVSGLNVAMLAAIALVALKTLRVRPSAAVLITVPLLLFYAIVTGLSASCVRATIMAVLILLGPVFDRRPVIYNSIFAAALLILAVDTNQLFAPGFQFSFILALTIVGLARHIQGWVQPWGQPDSFLPRCFWGWHLRSRTWLWNALATALGVTVSAWLGSLVFTAGYFHLFAPASLLANLCAVPLAFGILALGVATLLVAPWLKAAALLFNNANWLLAKALLWVVQIFAFLPGGHVFVEVPSLSPPPLAELTVLDVGEGAALHLRAGGGEWLVDCGSAVSYGRTVLPYLRTRGVNGLDGLLLTHGDAQHLGGAPEVLEDFAPPRVGQSVLRDRSPLRAQLARTLAGRRQGKSLYQAGDFIHFAPGATARVLFPPAALVRSNADDKALVVQLDIAGTRVLLMSDSGFATERWLLENASDLRSDLVIKGQHDKDLSGLPDFLERVQPQAVICSGLGFDRHADALDAWERAARDRGLAVFRQDHTGAVRVEVRAGGCTVRAFATGQTFRSRAR